MHVTGPGLMHMQRPGRRVAGCGSCRRIQLIAVVGLRRWANVSRLCKCIGSCPALVPACVYRPTTAPLCNRVQPTTLQFRGTCGRVLAGRSVRFDSTGTPVGLCCFLGSDSCSWPCLVLASSMEIPPSNDCMHTFRGTISLSGTSSLGASAV